MADCLFCKVVAGEVPAKVVKRTDEAVAFRDIDPKAPTHVLVIPTQHIPAARDANGPGSDLLLGRLLSFTVQVATELGLDAKGYRIVTNTGTDAGQTVDHLHFHILGGRRLTWPPG
ncbi:MAG: histidine triad nucleotide-binding protein [Gemmatimonadales bacterium]